MNTIKMIVGLSNPQKKYNNTRHNVGSWYIQLLANRYSSFLIQEKKFFGFTALLSINKKIIRLLIPNIFMNINGTSVYKMASFYNIFLHEILIIHDDLNIQPGIVKLTHSYGHSGHNGLRDVLSKFTTKINFYRFRIGIGRPKNQKEVASFVLSSPTNEEELLIKKSIFHAIQKTIVLIGL